MADVVKFSDDEKKLLLLALNQLRSSTARSAAKATSPMFAPVYAKQLELIHVLLAKVGGL